MFVLQYYQGSGCKLIGAFNAASNITGVLTDTDVVSSLMHKYGGLVFWDYAASGKFRFVYKHQFPLQIFEKC